MLCKFFNADAHLQINITIVEEKKKNERAQLFISSTRFFFFVNYAYARESEGVRHVRHESSHTLFHTIAIIAMFLNLFSSDAALELVLFWSANY